ncbi:hypothetical protein I316_01553 [Kwoniella heveanensis BCC8398]|uniref:Uncharacterized protein n=1 Tax=Kwoniella heveanensis BCC8398 TaxID=1296120 RepID=A0A1B9H113_9TREE|nr:hypothetical protein I316_01553 [Kwoniella heveanensis BCC8398]
MKQKLEVLNNSATGTEKGASDIMTSVLWNTNDRLLSLQGYEKSKATFYGTLEGVGVGTLINSASIALSGDHPLRANLSAVMECKKRLDRVSTEVSRALQLYDKIYPSDGSTAGAESSPGDLPRANQAVRSKLDTRRTGMETCKINFAASTQANQACQGGPSNQQLDSARRARELIGSLRADLESDQQEFLKPLHTDTPTSAQRTNRDLKAMRNAADIHHELGNLSASWRAVTENAIQNGITHAIQQLSGSGQRLVQSVNTLNDAIRAGSCAIPTKETTMQDLPEPLREYWDHKLALREEIESSKAAVESWSSNALDALPA